jgi:alkanesulfonate monooxygenase SsuD/methylene tetrahydromethanopterin reductase-like flavin-dependent oxidoreductase (luciferase family)
VKLSAFTVVDDYSDPSDSHRLSDVVDLAASVEGAGLSGLWIAEHHFHAGGVCPAPPVLLAACGSRTHRIRLGSLVSVLPFHSAIEVAEQYAMVDRLIGGRLNLGLGSGYIAAEFEGFGVDPSTKRERFDESLATLRKAFAGEEVRAPGASARPVRLNVRPVQSPHPPVWIAVQRREAVPFVARHRAHLALIPYATMADLDELRAVISEYRAASPPGFQGEVAVGLHLYAGPSTETAHAALQRYLDSRLVTQSTFFQQKVRADPRHAQAAAVEEAGWALFGAPEGVADRLRAFSDAGVDEALGIFDFGGLPAAESHRSIRELGRAVADRARPASS